MSGIVGLWNLEGRPVDPGLPAAMSAALAHRGPDGEGLWQDGPVALGCRLQRATPESRQETQPLVHPDGPVIVFDGRLDNRNELLRLLKGAWGAGPGDPDPALVLAAFEAWGDHFPARLNGDFALAIFDPRHRRLLLARDAVGVRTLYYYRGAGVFLLASEIKAILAHPSVAARPSDDYLADFFGRELDCPQEGLTFFANVFELLPGQVARIDSRGLTVKQYWDFDPGRRVRLASFKEYAAAFRQLFEQAVRRRLRSAWPVAVAVSGGLDSSAIFCMAESLRQAAPGQYPNLLGITLHCPDGSAADEEAYVREIERQYGVSVERLPLGDYRLAENLEEELWYREAPYLEYENLSRLLGTACQRSARVVLYGLGGDEYLADLGYLIDLFQGLEWRELSRHLRKLHHWGSVANRPYTPDFIKQLLRHHLPEAVEDGLRRVLNRPVSRTIALPHCSPALLQRTDRPRRSPFSGRRQAGTVHAKSLYRLLRSANEVFWWDHVSKLGSRYGAEVAFPFLDRDLLAFLMAIPGQMINRQGVSKGILREGLGGILPEAIARRRWKADFSHLINPAMTRDFSRVMDYLENGGLALCRDCVEEAGLGEELRRLRANVLAPNILIAKKLTMLLSLMVWKRVFFGTQPLSF